MCRLMNVWTFSINTRTDKSDNIFSLDSFEVIHVNCFCFHHCENYSTEKYVSLLIVFSSRIFHHRCRTRWLSKQKQPLK